MAENYTPADEEEEIVCAPSAKDDFIIAVSSNEMGQGEKALGQTLIKAFLFAVTKQDKLPSKVLSSEGIKTNLTLIFNPNQALLAARAGATYVSPFLGRLDDISQNGLDLIADIREIFDAAGDIDTQIICASVRNPIHVTECAKMGADIATVPYNVFEQMMKHPLTDQGIEKFQADYKAVFGE